MFKFLRSRFGEVKSVQETQRQTFERALGEVNAILTLMDPKPKITFDPAAGTFEMELPDQMPDEALALPAPAAEEATPVAEEAAPVAEDETVEKKAA